MAALHDTLEYEKTARSKMQFSTAHDLALVGDSCEVVGSTMIFAERTIRVHIIGKIALPAHQLLLARCFRRLKQLGIASPGFGWE